MTQPMRQLADAHNVRFGTSGVRGLVADLSDAVCYAYAQAFLQTVAAGSSRVVVGHDLRPSSPRIAAACIEAIRDAGREVCSLVPYRPLRLRITACCTAIQASS